LEPTGRIAVGADLDGLQIWGCAYGSIDVGGGCLGLAVNDGAMGPIHVGADLLDFGAYGLAGTLYVGGDLDSLQVWNFATGLVDVQGDLTGSFQVWNSWTGAELKVRGNVGGGIHVGGWLAGPRSLLGRINITGNLAGTLEVTASIIEPQPPGDNGRITVGGAVTSTATFTVGDDVQGHIWIGGDLEADLLIDGGLINVASAGPETEVVGTKPADVLIVVNNDGPNQWDDYWQDGAIVRINGVEYPGPNWDENLWAGTCVVGDAQNDGVLNALDIGPFVAALEWWTPPQDPDEPYAQEYRGLLNSFPYKGDMSCDGAFNAFDLDAFVYYLTHPQEHPPCQVCPGAGEG